MSTKSDHRGGAAAIAAAGLLLACAGAPLPADLKRAQALEAAGDREAALAVYGEALGGCRTPGARPHDDCGLAAFRRAQLLEDLGRYPDAVAAYQAVRPISLDGRLISRAAQRAALLLADRLGQREAAVALCREVIDRWPDEIPAEDALRLWNQLWRDEPGWPAELDRLAATLSRHETAGFALLYRAERAERDGDTGTAVARYDELWRRLTRGPLRDDAALRAARLLRAAGRPTEAVQRLEALEETYRKAWFVGHYNSLLLDDGALLLGQLYLEDLHQPARAVAVLAGFLKRQPRSLLCDDALLLMARAALQRQGTPGAAEQREACGYLQRLFKDYPSGNRAREAQTEGQRLGCADAKAQ